MPSPNPPSSIPQEVIDVLIKSREANDKATEAALNAKSIQDAADDLAQKAQEALAAYYGGGAQPSYIELLVRANSKKLDVVIRKLNEVLAQGVKLMALADDLKAGIAQLNNETTAIGDLITKLASGIKNSMTDAEVADVKSGLGALSDRLTGLAVDPTNPVPPPSPQFQALKAKK